MWTYYNNLSVSWTADLLLTLAVSALAIGLGTRLRDSVGWLKRANIPGAALGGLLVACLVVALRGRLNIAFNDTLRNPLQMLFYATIGLQVTGTVLRRGGPQMLIFWAIAAGTAIAQNVVGVAAAHALGISPLIGIMCGAVSLTGGPATGLAFADMFRSLGVPAAGEIIIASATFGIFIASLIGNPVVTRLIRPGAPSPAAGPIPTASVVAPVIDTAPHELLRILLILVLIVGAGALISIALSALQLRIATSIAPMLVGAIVRWMDDRWRIVRLNMPLVDAIGSASLAFFLAIALMGLRLWELSALAGPMLILLALQTIVTVVYCVTITWTIMGRDYEAAVITSGHIGFALGITPNAVANMESLVERYGPAPRAFLIVPVIGAFFIDFANSLIITASVNLISP